MDINARSLSFPLGFYMGVPVVSRDQTKRPPPDTSQTKFDDSTQTFDNSATTWDGKRSPPPPPNYAGFVVFDQAGQSGATLLVGLT